MRGHCRNQLTKGMWSGSVLERRRSCGPDEPDGNAEEAGVHLEWGEAELHSKVGVPGPETAFDYAKRLTSRNDLEK
jgi:hypothetical protein